MGQCEHFPELFIVERAKKDYIRNLGKIIDSFLHYEIINLKLTPNFVSINRIIIYYNIKLKHFYSILKLNIIHQSFSQNLSIYKKNKKK